MAERNKRDLPDWLFQTLEWDKKITKTAFEWFDGHFGYKKYRSHMKALELSGHGLIWLVLCFAMLYFGFDPSLWSNMLMLQFLDIILIAITKAIARRRRPALSEDDMFVTLGPDKFSFPSGHASRCCAVALFFVWLYPLGMILSLPFVVWATVVAISRVCLARHHILDVIGGVALAFAEYLIMSVLWLDEAKASKFASVFADSEDPWSSG